MTPATDSPSATETPLCNTLELALACTGIERSHLQHRQLQPQAAPGCLYGCGIRMPAMAAAAPCFGCISCMLGRRIVLRLCLLLLQLVLRRHSEGVQGGSTGLLQGFQGMQGKLGRASLRRADGMPQSITECCNRVLSSLTV